MIKGILKKIVVLVIESEAKIILKKYKPKIVAVTGSVGKTSTKDAIYTVFSGTFFTRKSVKSFNSDIGIPLTILGCVNGWNNFFIWIKNILIGLDLILFKRNYPEWLILEVGADRPGDIKKITKWLKPDVAVVTRMSKVPVHIEFFRSVEELIKEKSYLVKAVKPNGIVILNSDDEKVLSMANLTSARKITYGFLGGADFQASNDSILYKKDTIENIPEGISFKVNHNGNSAPVSIIGSLGKQHMYPALASIATAFLEDINIVKATERLSLHCPPPGRMKIIPGVKNSILIDDSYNSSPVALNEAIVVLGNIQVSGKKIAVIGDMLELGKYSVDEHKKAGNALAEVCAILITVGMRSRYIAEGALDAGMDEKNIYQFEDSREAGKFLENIITTGDVALIKGSQSIRMERIVLEVMASPENAKDLLVRQEEEWLKKK